MAFVFGVPLVERSNKGWTRGMPPPRAGRRLVVRNTQQLSRPVGSGELSEEDNRMKDRDMNASVREFVCEESLASAEETIALNNEVERVIDGKTVEARRNCTELGADGTRAVHGGERVKGGKKGKAVMDALTTPVVLSSTFTFRNSAECIMYNMGKYESFEYGRYGNPTTRAAEEKLAVLECADDALISSSGMNAVTTMLLSLVPENGHIVVTTDCYRRTRQFIRTLLPKMGIRATVIDPADIESLERILETEGADLFFSESPTNPQLRVVDTPRIVDICKKYKTISVIDTTFATPVNCKPITEGADLVLHSGTKYLAGHNDVLCGALAGRGDLVAQVRGLHGILGGVVDPHAAYLLIRGMKTLELRIMQQNRTAEQLAQYLYRHPKIARVWYPTIPNHPDFETAKRQASKGWGGVLSFEVAGDPWAKSTFDKTNKFVDALKIPYIGPSLGGTESLVEQVCIMGYFDQPLEARMSFGITNGFVRFACGIENTSDIINDVSQALAQI
mmetsp:Transcript_1533/g.4640  ORF Transcript_1533/g.4640 Transcript_1533/m.4640 type:complete len:506 (+) Transcript_1533:151-1668(+)|eukprot:CAMPEP_0198731300 /NCGR_PEP_ID=MMETSP1475-20131203/29211_1 /TAXON_ID= ORGANISM="Unidentified sp., Strain CCMP1999" /NCGR_SAMPLE_ID=MMETSP1475 /ASSEMBLY_ACC=CAM_ASM_001111 /LENGTH=505 /DNA_ID=CAMNT_0044494253 /DNA_START=109 /DNA_END=1626 /DNA_ORIENTATION=-